MGLKCGIVGLPNVGKSTFFNAICDKANAEAANYPFCTIEPNKAFVDVPDSRLNEVARIAKSEKIIPARIEFIDIAGLIEGASKGEGCGNKFLGHILEVDLIVHVVRCFEDSNIAHVSGNVDPIRDIKIIHDELIIYDLIKLEQKYENLIKKSKSNSDAKIKEEKDLVQDLISHLSKGMLIRQYPNFSKFSKEIKSLFLLTSKPVLYICNIGEDYLKQGHNKYSALVKNNFSNFSVINVCAKFENEVKVFDDINDRKDFLLQSGVVQSGIDAVICQAFTTLGLSAYFTAGQQESRMWTIKSGATAVEAARVIHSDFADGFIKAEVISYENYLKYGEKVNEMGFLQIEGKEYVVKDGDIMHFRFSKKNK